MGFVRIAWKNNIQEAYLPKTGIVGQIVSEILAQLCSDDSMQILLNLTWVITLWHESNLCICKDHINAHAHWISHLLLIWIESKAFLSGSLSQPFCFAFRQRFVSEQFIFFLFFFRENMNLMRMQTKLCFLEKILMKRMKKKMNDRGKDSYNYCLSWCGQTASKHCKIIVMI